MDWALEGLMALRAILAAVAGGLIGWERERHGREAGVRTYAAVLLGAAVFGLVSSHVAGAPDPTWRRRSSRGSGSWGPGVILREQGRISGLTTAATIWATASIGLAIAYGMYVLGVLAMLIILGLLLAHDLPGWHRIGRKYAHHGRRESAGPERGDRHG